MLQISFLHRNNVSIERFTFVGGNSIEVFFGSHSVKILIARIFQKVLLKLIYLDIIGSSRYSNLSCSISTVMISSIILPIESFQLVQRFSSGNSFFQSFHPEPDSPKIPKKLIIFIHLLSMSCFAVSTGLISL